MLSWYYLYMKQYVGPVWFSEDTGPQANCEYVFNIYGIY